MDEGRESGRGGIPLPDLVEAAERVRPPLPRPRGVVLRAGDGVAQVAGLEEAGFEELIRFDSGALGLVFDLHPEHAGVLLLSGAEDVRAGEGALPTGRLPELPVGPGLLGRIVDPLGRALDSGPPVPVEPRLELFRPAPELLDRRDVDRPLHTGVLVVDAAIPIGRGQRELIIGDPNVGKTALAEDIVAAQREGDVTCVYVVIGQPMSRVLALREVLERAGVLDRTAIIAGDASMTPGMRYLAPYAGASAAEWFRAEGGDALVVYDDLTKHADAYRELSLLMGRPPGREAFPGDVFYIHAELLERATALREERGGGSVTALPIVETTGGDLAAYIPTNVISITDGQIHLDGERFARNQRPAVDVGRSVSRIGGRAQPAPLRLAARNLRVLHARFEELEGLARVGLELEPGAELEIARGRALRALLRQARLSPRSIGEEVVAVLAVTSGWVDGMDPEQVPRFATDLVGHLHREEPELMRRLDAGELPEEGWIDRLARRAEALRRVREEGDAPASAPAATGERAP